MLQIDKKNRKRNFEAENRDGEKEAGGGTNEAKLEDEWESYW